MCSSTANRFIMTRRRAHQVEGTYNLAMQAPVGYRVVTAAYAIDEDSNYKPFSSNGPLYQRNATTGLVDTVFWHYNLDSTTPSNHVALTFQLICERSDEPDLAYESEPAEIFGP